MATLFGIVFEDPRQYNVFAFPVYALFELEQSGRYWVDAVVGVIAIGFIAGLIYSLIVRRNPLVALKVTIREFFTGFKEIFALLGKLFPYAIVALVPAAAASGVLTDLGQLEGRYGVTNANAGQVRNTLWIVWFVALLAAIFFWPSLRRVRAIAQLCFKEALRGRILFVFLLFFLPFLFAGWYLEKVPEGTLLYLIGFVSTAITFILMPLVIFMTSMSLPNEVAARIVQTVVTKPVRRSEIVFGRALGYIAVYTIVLVGMGVVSGFYIYAQLKPDQRERLWVTRKPILANAPPIDAVKYFRESVNGETRQPLLFRRNNKWDFVGTNVGKEWNYRYHVGGMTNDAAVYGYRFEPTGIQKFQDEDLGEVCRLLMEFDVFKMTKGDPLRTVGEKAERSGVRCLVEVRQLSADGTPTGKQYGKIVRINHQRRTELVIPANLCSTGRMEASVKCVTVDQFVGMAPGDMYFLANEGSFAQNFAKGLVSIWLKMVVVICVAVAASTVLKGFVTVLLTTVLYILGMFWLFMWQVALGSQGDLKGGGPLESFIRLANQQNQVVTIDINNPVNRILLGSDEGLLWLMRKIAYVVPNLSDLDVVQYVAHGVDVPGVLVLRNAILVFAYSIPVLVLGFFLFRNRELAA